MRWSALGAGTVALGMTLGGAGCGPHEAGYREVPKGARVQEAPHDHHDHGPHGGHIVELGEEEYHAEVTFDPKAAKITVYILDSSAAKANPIDAKDVALNLTIDGKPKVFTATAAPQDGDPKGKSSRFEVVGNADVKAHIKDEEDLKGNVAVTIAGKSYKGEIEHDHGH